MRRPRAAPSGPGGRGSACRRTDRSSPPSPAWKPATCRLAWAWRVREPVAVPARPWRGPLDEAEPPADPRRGRPHRAQPRAGPGARRRRLSPAADVIVLLTRDGACPRRSCWRPRRVSRSCRTTSTAPASPPRSAATGSSRPTATSRLRPAPWSTCWWRRIGPRPSTPHRGCAVAVLAGYRTRDVLMLERLTPAWFGWCRSEAVPQRSSPASARARRDHVATEDGDPIVAEAVDRPLHGDARPRYPVAVQHGRCRPRPRRRGAPRSSRRAAGRVSSRSVTSGER